MALFFKKQSAEEKEAKKQEKALKKEADTVFMGHSLQPIGKISNGMVVVLKPNPVEKKLVLAHEKIEISLPYERIKGFKLEDEVKIAKSGSAIGRALVGGTLFGGTGALVGAASAKGNTKIRWIGTLSYEDKNGELQELSFIQWGMSDGGYYVGADKHYGGAQFENLINKIASDHGEDITEL